MAANFHQKSLELAMIAGNIHQKSLELATMAGNLPEFSYFCSKSQTPPGRLKRPANATTRAQTEC